MRRRRRARARNQFCSKRRAAAVAGAVGGLLCSVAERCLYQRMQQRVWRSVANRLLVVADLIDASRSTTRRPSLKRRTNSQRSPRAVPASSVYSSHLRIDLIV